MLSFARCFETFDWKGAIVRQNLNELKVKVLRFVSQENKRDGFYWHLKHLLFDSLAAAVPLYIRLSLYIRLKTLSRMFDPRYNFFLSVGYCFYIPFIRC